MAAILNIVDQQMIICVSMVPGRVQKVLSAKGKDLGGAVHQLPVNEVYIA